MGCNVGAMSFEVGRRFAPKSILGIDIDPELIRVAKKFAENLKNYQVRIETKSAEVIRRMKMRLEWS